MELIDIKTSLGEFRLASFVESKHLSMSVNPRVVKTNAQVEVSFCVRFKGHDTNEKVVFDTHHHLVAIYQSCNGVSEIELIQRAFHDSWPAMREFLSNSISRLKAKHFSFPPSASVAFESVRHHIEEKVEKGELTIEQK